MYLYTYLPAWQTKCGFYHLSHTMIVLIVLFSAKKHPKNVFHCKTLHTKTMKYSIVQSEYSTNLVLLKLLMSEKLLRLLFTHKCRGTTCRWFGGMLLTYLSTYKQNSKILIFHSHPTTYVMMSYGAVRCWRALGSYVLYRICFTEAALPGLHTIQFPW